MYSIVYTPDSPCKAKASSVYGRVYTGVQGLASTPPQQIMEIRTNNSLNFPRPTYHTGAGSLVMVFGAQSVEWYL